LKHSCTFQTKQKVPDRTTQRTTANIRGFRMLCPPQNEKAEGTNQKRKFLENEDIFHRVKPQQRCSKHVGARGISADERWFGTLKNKGIIIHS